MDGRSKKILSISRDSANIRYFKTDLYFSETSSRPSKATLKAMKIATFTFQNLPKEKMRNTKCSYKSFLKLKVYGNRQKDNLNRLIRTRDK